MFNTIERIRNGLWFGTIEKMQWFQTPLSGATSDPEDWNSEGTTLNGLGYSFSSFGSHKIYNYEWSGASSKQTAQTMKSYADGTFGRGLIYFIDPLTYDTNVLPARLADPSMAAGYEGTSLVNGVEPTTLSATSGNNNFPVLSTTYDLSGVASGFRGTREAVFIPVPEGHTLALGAVYTASGTGGVYASPQLNTGAVGAAVKLTALSSSSTQLVVDKFNGVVGVWIWVGKTTSAASNVNIHAMTGRVMTDVEAVDPTQFALYQHGPWIGGQGHAGARFSGKPTYTENGPDRIGFAATFKEVIN